MRHRLFGKKLGRTSRQRQSLFRSLCLGLLTHGKVITTKAKARAVVPMAEDLINKIVKQPPLIAQRHLHRHFANRHQVAPIYSQVKTVFEGVTSNYTRVVHIGLRQGDNSVMVELSLAKKLIKPVASTPTPDKKIPLLKGKAPTVVGERVLKVKKSKTTK